MVDDLFGFLTPFKGWVILGGVLAALAVVGYVEYKVYNAGYDSAEQVWKARESDELRAANAEIIRLTDEAKAKEAAHQKALAAIAVNHQKEITKNANRKQKDIDDAVSGALVLRFRAPCQSSGAGGIGQAGAGTGISDGSTLIELPRKVNVDLSGLANDADAVADQLRAAQEVIREDRRLCGAAITSPNHE